MITENAHWMYPFLAGAGGQLVGMLVGYKALTYRVDRVERDHQRCMDERQQVERRILAKVDEVSTDFFTVKTDVAVIKERIKARR